MLQWLVVVWWGVIHLSVSNLGTTASWGTCCSEVAEQPAKLGNLFHILCIGVFSLQGGEGSKGFAKQTGYAIPNKPCPSCSVLQTEIVKWIYKYITKQFLRTPEHFQTSVTSFLRHGVIKAMDQPCCIGFWIVSYLKFSWVIYLCVCFSCTKLTHLLDSSYLFCQSLSQLVEVAVQT